MRKYLLMLLLSLLGCLSAIYFFGYAECYANYLLEKNAAFVNGLGGALKFEYSKYCNVTYSLNFLDYSMLAPFFVVLVNRYTQIVAAFWTVISIALAFVCMNFIADVSDDESLSRLFEHIGSKYGHLDAAVNNASPKIMSQGAFQEIPAENLFSTLKSDFGSYVVCLQKELNLMDSGGCIVNVSSVNGLRPCPGAAMYSAAKHGLEGLTKSVALEAIQKGIRVNAVAPGVTWTFRWEERENSNPNIRAEVEPQIPIKRFAIESEIVNAIEWLCSTKSSYVVGHTLVVDGGLSLS